MRNRIAHLEVRLKDEAIPLLDTLQVDELNENGREGRLWTNYQKPQIEKVLSVVQSSSPLERAYFYRFSLLLKRNTIWRKPLLQSRGICPWRRNGRRAWSMPVCALLIA